MLISLAVDFRTADLGTRERFHLSEERVAQLYRQRRASPIAELALVSTCNRTELYGWVGADGPTSLPRMVDELAAVWADAPDDRAALVELATQRAGDAVARHLLRVGAGLESQILGDAQILGQIRSAYRLADRSGAVGSTLHRLFATALRAGKRVQTETSLIGPGNSVGMRAAAIVQSRLGGLAGKRCVLVGCGKTGTQAARRLVKLGVGTLVLVNRTPATAQRLARELGVDWAPYETLHQELARADAGIVATGADLPPVRSSSLAWCRAQAETDDLPLLLVDVAMPRNVEPEAAGLPGVAVVDLDSLNSQLHDGARVRRTAVPAAERIVAEELEAFQAWVAAGAARDALRPLRDVLEQICRREVGFAAGDDVARRTADRIVAKLSARAMPVLRGALSRGDSVAEIAATMRLLFEQPEGADAAPSDRPLARAG